MAKKSGIMSLSLDPETQDKLRLFAKQKTNGNVSKLVRDLADKYLVDEDDTIQVVLKVPVVLKGDPENLKKWMDVKASGIVKALTE